MNKHVHREAGADSFVGAHFVLIAGLMALATMLLCGCASVNATGGTNSAERSVAPGTTTADTYETFGRDPTPAEISAMPWLVGAKRENKNAR